MESEGNRSYGSGGGVPEGAGAEAPSRLTDLVRGAGDVPVLPLAEAFAALPTGQEAAHAALASELADLHAGNGDPDALVEAFRACVVLVPHFEGGLWATRSDGLHWVYAFSDDAQLARFAVARGADGSQDWEFTGVYGWRLLDEVVPAIGEPAGVALDVAGRRPMLFPPVVGVVPDEAAVDAAGYREAR